MIVRDWILGHHPTPRASTSLGSHVDVMSHDGVRVLVPLMTLREDLSRHKILTLASCGSLEAGIPELRQPALCEVNDAQNYLQTEGLNIHQCAKKIRVLQIVLEAKRKEFVDDALIYAKSLREELEISLEPPRRIRRKHMFGDGSKDDQLSYEDDLRRTMFSFQ
ncbi:uncharacterized protein TNCV_154491 [Trichonephila clavipes]|uniref:Uncharacterized protein n=1 Tax=Trichonephila clavipes TaxID=2585209 RepID=A0A8X7BK51_TRICX|nr:uncharacterized protein TNCV_154491 [Trichonephila clavipes]